MFDNVVGVEIVDGKIFMCAPTVEGCVRLCPSCDNDVACDVARAVVTVVKVLRAECDASVFARAARGGNGFAFNVIR